MKTYCAPIKPAGLLGSVSLFLLSVMSLCYAQTGGPAQPEFSNFEPVSTSQMVNPFDGSFTYNLPVLSIPGPDGSGYALSLSYHSGVTPVAEPSWVGYGWTLNPGSIVRNTRGLPDDYKGEQIKYWNKTPKNVTIAGTLNINAELFGKKEGEESSPFSFGVDLSGTIRWNNLKGFSYSRSLGVHGGLKAINPDAKGLVSLSLVTDNGDNSFTGSINPAAIITGRINKSKKEDANKKEKFDIGKQFRLGKTVGLFDHSHYSFSESVRPVNTVEYEGASYNLSGSIQWNPSFLPAGVEVGASGTYTWQQNIEFDDLRTYGYLYSGYAGENDIMDYYTERLEPYSKRDRFLSTPFSNADNFTLTGEGVGGGFRLHSTTAGHFYPNRKSSGITIYQVGAEFQGGPNSGVGGDIGIGKHWLTVEPWEDVREDEENRPNLEYRFPKVGDDRSSYFFRFNNDRGGNVLFAEGTAADKPVGATKVAAGTPVSSLVAIDVDPIVSSQISADIVQNPKRSSFIGYHTNSEMMEISDRKYGVGDWNVEGIPYKSYNKDAISRSFVHRENIGDGIGEFAVFNDAGYRYVYGLPVYSRNEKSYQFGVQGVSGVKDSYLVYKDKNPNYSDVAVGEEQNEPYASSYLLTEITTPDYVDRTGDGPTPDDFGGYTKFNYRRVAGSNNKKDTDLDWYKWRFPYYGLLYQRNSLSDPLDDMGTVSFGEREVYYLESIETKTHIAKFITNEMLDENEKFTRKDGFEARVEAFASTFEDAPGQVWPFQSTSSTNYSEQLMKIELWSKKDGVPEELMQTVNFEYDNSLMPGQLNAYRGGSISEGKLTLKKVWFEYNGKYNAKIAPYSFGYEYRTSTDYATSIQNAYPDLVSYGDQYDALIDDGDPNSQSVQNPVYSPFDADRWGYYQFDGKSRHEILNPWVDQSPDSKFDPAAWHLKTITLPSGGEFQVHYEQNDYDYVQDEQAMAMVSLVVPRDGAGDVVGHDVVTQENIPDRYYLNVEDLGLISTDPGYEAELNDLRNLIHDKFVDKKEKIYFKFLYGLRGQWEYFDQEEQTQKYYIQNGEISDPNVPLNTCNSEYIDGYVKVKSVNVDATTTPKTLYVELGSDGSDEYDIPREVCLDFFQKERNYNFEEGDCGGSSGIPSDGPESGWRAVMGLFGIDGLLLGEDCAKLAYQHSYLRIPLTRPKKGGGVRVKRLLMYDAGIASEDPRLFGQSYLYRTEEGRSSGVATNEPGVGREENAVVKEIKKRDGQSDLNKIISGTDKEQFEGPIGESILPAPVVGYSRVVVEDINQWNTIYDLGGPTFTLMDNNSGHTVHEYYTAKDYPMGTKYVPAATHIDPVTQEEVVDVPAGLEKQSVWSDKNDDVPGLLGGWLVIPAVIANYYRSESWVSQGYSFIMNEMHGQPKRKTTFAGAYSSSLLDAPTNIVEYTYYQPGEPIPLFNDEKDIGKDISDLPTGYPGKEMEVVFEGRSVVDEKFDVNAEIDFSVGFIPPLIVIPFFTAIPTVSYSINGLHTHVTSKVVRYPAVTKEVRSIRDGVTDVVQYLAFDPETGNPALTRTHDDYDGEILAGASDPHVGDYHSYTFSATDVYDALGQKALSEGSTINSQEAELYIQKEYLGVMDGANTTLKPYLAFQFHDAASVGELGKLTSGDLIKLTKPGGLFAGMYHVGNIRGNMVELLPLGIVEEIVSKSDDEEKIVNIEIVSSGKTNQLTASRGGVVTYGEPQLVQSLAKDQQFNSTYEVEYDKRKAMVDDLNVIADGIKQGIYAGIDMEFDDAYNIADIYGGCNERAALSQWIYMFDSEGDGDRALAISVTSRNFSETPSATTFSNYPPTSHSLVDALNASLNRAWGGEIENLESVKKNSEYYLSCQECPAYFPPGSDPVDYSEKTLSSAARNEILDYLLVNQMKSATFDLNGTGVAGSDIVVSDENDIGDAMVDYNSGEVKSRKFVLRLVDPNDNSNKITVEIKVDARKYNPQEDEHKVYDVLKYESTPAKAEVSLIVESNTWTYDNGGGALPISGTMSWLGSKIYSSYANSDNENIYSYFDKSNFDFVDNIIEFGVDPSGYLTVEFKQPDYPPSSMTIIMGSGPVNSIITTGIQLWGSSPSRSSQEEYCVIELDENMLDNGTAPFELDPDTWEVVYRPNPDADPIPIPCLDFCDDIYVNTQLDGVISANALTFSDQWPYDDEEYDYDYGSQEIEDVVENSNDYEKGVKGKWRPDGQSVYRTTIKGGAGTFGDPSERTYDNAGVYDNFTLFNTRDLENNDPDWIKPYTITQYTPHGIQSEGHDVFDIYSATRFSHGGTVPAIVAQNAAYNTIGFESFEDGMGNAPGVAHSGDNSFEIDGNDHEMLKIKWTQQMEDEGMVVRFWAKTLFNDESNRDAYLDPEDPNYREAPFVYLHLLNEPSGSPASWSASLYEWKKIARTGEWTLYEYELLTCNAVVGSVVRISPVIASATGPYGGTEPAQVWIDDIKVSPMNAQSNTYAYDDDNLRLLTSFDDQHFGVYYQYNGEGKLVRKLRETERGLKTVEERQYHRPLEERPDAPTTGTIPDYGPSLTISGINSQGNGNLQLSDEGKASASLLNLSVSPDKFDVRVIGTDPDKAQVSGLEKLRDPKFLNPGDLAQRLKHFDLSSLEKAKLIEDLNQINKDCRELEEVDEKQLTEAEQKVRSEKLQELYAKRDDLLKTKLGLNDEELREWYENAVTPESEQVSTQKEESE